MNNREQELLELIIQIEMLTRREMMGRYHNSHSRMNSNRGQGRIMAALRLKPEISQRELSYLLNMSKQGLAELLGKLEMAGYIDRSPSMEDGRVMMVRLTEQGKMAADEMQEKESKSKSIFACLEEEEQNNLKLYLEKMISNAQDQIPDGMKRRHHHRYERRFERDE